MNKHKHGWGTWRVVLIAAVLMGLLVLGLNRLADWQEANTVYQTKCGKIIEKYTLQTHVNDNIYPYLILFRDEQGKKRTYHPKNLEEFISSGVGETICITKTSEGWKADVH